MASVAPKPAARRLRAWAWRELDRRLPNLTRRHRFESLPITLNQRRVYIVPSGFGLFFALMMVVILAGALNYTQYDYFKRLLMHLIAKQRGRSTDTAHDHEYTDWDDLTRFVEEFLAVAPLEESGH